MPSDKPRPGAQPAWKGAASSGKAAGGPKFGWKPEEKAAVETTRWVRRAKLSAYIFGGLGCVALIVALIYLLQQKPGVRLVIVGADPAADVEKLDAPLDPFGWRAGVRLADWSNRANADQARRNKLTPRLADESQLAPEPLRPADLPAFLQKLEKRDLDPLVVYFGLHGGADTGGPFLFTGGGERLYLRGLLDGFAGNSRLKEKHVVLLFDAARLDPDPAVGMMYADFVRGLKTLDEEGVFARTPQLVAISASDAGERGWSAEEWGSTVFAETVLRGLSGAAKPSKGDLITAADLFDYVHDQTQSWSQSTRPSASTPILLPKNGGRERAQEMVLTAKVGEPADWLPAEPFVAPESLVKHWTAARELEDGVPSPAVYTPRSWRRYRELLLRYGQLYRAREDGAAKRLGDVLDRTEQELRDGRGLRLAGGEAPSSRGNALPLPAALGLAGNAGSDTAFNAILRAKDEKNWENLWTAAVTASAAPDVLRTRFYEFLLKRAAEQGAGRDVIDLADRLMAMPALNNAGTRPAEAHLLVMTRAFFTDPRAQTPGIAGEPSLELWKRALDVRRLAERAALSVNPPPPGTAAPPHPYSEALWTYLGSAVVEADIRRRDGEDRLFASQQAAYDRAKDELDAAAKAYEGVLLQAQVLQAAYATRDDALADLPLLTRWVASLPATKPDVRAQAEVVRNVWPKVHALARRLDGADRPAGTDTVTAEIRTDVHRLKQDYRDHCRRLADKDLQGQWEAIEQVLAVPPMLIEPDLRKAIAESGRRQAAKLTAAWVANPTAVAPPPSTAAEDARTARRAQAVQQAELATAVLGDIPKDQPSDRKGKLLPPEGLQIELARLPKENWQPAIDIVGEHVGRHWQVLAAPADKDAPVDDARAESRSRWAVAFRSTEGAEPATTARQKRWQKLFVALAHRTARDHWYEVGQRPDEYFRAAAKLFLADAKKAVGDGTAAAPGEAPVTELLTADRLALEPERFGAKVGWTSENRRTFTFAVKAPKTGPGGYVTLWSQIGASESLSLNPDDQPRVPVPLPPTNSQMPAKRDLHVEAKRTATDDAVRLAAVGYFRGQWLRSETAIALNRTPELVVSRAPPPDNAAVAVRAADNLDLGAIAIVLDFSGSMAQLPLKPGQSDPDTDWQDPQSKHRQALSTLKEVLLRLPPGTPISLRLFGHDYDKDLWARLQKEIPAGNKAAREVALTEATLSDRIYKGTVTWNPGNQGPLNEIIERLRGTQPQWGTPLLRNMVLAKDDFPADYKGTKTLLVLTDGADTSVLPADRVPQIKRQLRQEFADANVSIQMVLFRVDDAELKTALAQFKEDVEEKFQPPGRVWVAGENSKLKDMIDFALRPKLRLVELTGGLPKNMPRSGLPANRPTDGLTDLRWTPGIGPTLYKGYVFTSNQPFNLQRGDRMLVRLSKDSDRVRFERDLLADDPRLAGRTARAGDWVMGLPFYHGQVTLREKQLWTTATLETPRGKDPDRDSNLQQTRPGFVWWDVAPEAGPRAKTVRVSDRPALPAPAWNLLAEGWPASGGRHKPAVVRAWADFAPPSSAYKVRIDAARIVAGDAVVEEAGEDGKVQVFASLEDWPLRIPNYTPDDKRSQTDKLNDTDHHFSTGDPPPVPCLVIRVLHPDKKPVYVRPTGVAFDADEQRYYGPSAAVTAAFGPVTSRDDLEAKLQGRPLELDLVSIERFKADHPPVVLPMGPAATEAPLVTSPELGEKGEKAP